MNGTMIKLHTVALIPKWNSKLILLGQLRENDITCHNISSTITLIKDEINITYTKKSYNIFTLDCAMPG